MATILESDNIERMASIGIAMPMLKNKWKVDKVSILDEDENFSVQVQAIDLNYKFNASIGLAFGFQPEFCHDLMLTLEEDISGAIAPIAKKLMTNKFDLVIHSLDGATTVLKTTTFKDCMGIGYKYSLNYATSKACKYPLKFVCKDIIYS